MKLIDPWFEAKFIAEVAKQENGLHSFRHLKSDGTAYTLAEAVGVEFWCPCGVNARDEQGELRYPLDLSLNKGRPHGVIVVFAGRGAPADFGPHSRGNPAEHPRWTVSGTGLDDLTTTPSIAVGEPECWHGYITNGDVT